MKGFDKALAAIKKKKKVAGTVLAFAFVSSMIFQLIPVNANAAGNKTADPATNGSWNANGAMDDSTRNVGRIWTDKTVATDKIDVKSPTEEVITVKNDDSDFLAALSTISSTATITGVKEEYVPLDIVLVLDTSGSMGQPLNVNGSWSEVYSGALDEGKTYYFHYNGLSSNYTPVAYVTEGNRSYWAYRGSSKWEEVKPKTGKDDTNRGHVQFYAHSNPTKLDELKKSVNAFIDKTVEANQKIEETDKKYRISLIQYNSTAITLNGLTVCEGEEAEQVKSNVNKLVPGGATRADDAMTNVQGQLNINSRSEAQKIIIFFTDGEPNANTGFDKNIANKVIQTAKTLKASTGQGAMSAQIYTIGMFDGANVEDTASQFNGYMHAVSSNYLNAEAYDNLGERTKDSDYYKTASDAAELDSVFQMIYENVVNQNASSPTHINQGSDATRGGYITFTDQLGDYMQVDKFKQIVVAGHEYTEVSEKTDNNKITYTFSGKVSGNPIYPEMDLSHILIEVERAGKDNLRTGDLVTVKIPAADIPIRHYKVNLDEDGNLTGPRFEIERITPLRIFYGISLKDGVMEKVEKPDAQMADYIRNYTDADGTLSFYSNAWKKGTAEAENEAAVTAEYVPAKTNRFYYFQEDKPLYIDEACTERATDIMDAGEDGNFYYQRTYYNEEGAQIETITIPKDSPLAVDDFAKTGDDGYLYIPKYSPRATLLARYKLDKETNVTGTADYATQPDWDKKDVDVPDGERNVIVRLGNNGKLNVDVPGELMITKHAELADGFTGPVDSDGKSTLAEQEFGFKISLMDEAGQTLDGSFTSEIFDKTGNPVGESKKIKDGGMFTLKDGQTIHIYGLPAGAKYVVKETDMPDGFRQTAPADDDGKAQNASGTITREQRAEAVFTNTYSAEQVTLVGSANLKVKKVYNAWDTVPSEFNIKLKAENGAPLPDGVSGDSAMITISDEADIQQSFGDITFTKAGEYIYYIFEETPEEADQVPGVSYSNAMYKVTVTVTDDGEGKLKVTSEMEKVQGDDGKSESPAAVEDTAVITNHFDAESQQVILGAEKEYTDNSGAKPLEAGMFTFQLEAVTPGAPMPGSADPTDKSYVSVVSAENIGRYADFGIITVGTEDIDQEYIYKITEVLPVAATEENSYTVNGMTYDANVYYMKISVSTEVKGEKLIVTAKRGVYYDKDCTQPAEASDYNSSNNSAPIFRNEYNVQPVTIPNSETPIVAEKTITGRDMAEGEVFDFALTAGDKKTADEMNQGNIVFVDKDGSSEEGKTDIQGQVTGAKQNVAEAIKFDFGKITFKKPGTYVFDLKEVNIPQTDENGMTYDRHTCKVTIEVTDTDSVLSAAVKKYDNGAASDDTSKGVFINKYTSTVNYGTLGGINVAKELTGRTEGMKNGEFNFTITKASENDEGAPEVSDADKNFANRPRNPGAIWDTTKLENLTFTQKDAGKTYKYIVDEVEPTGDGVTTDEQGIHKKGVTYDQSRYEVAIQIVDNQNGTLSTVTTVTQIMDKDGNPSEEVLGVYDSREESQEPKVKFTNTYGAESVSVTTPAKGNYFVKILSGRDWNDTDKFEFTIENTQRPEGVEPDSIMPKDTDGNTVTSVPVTKDNLTPDDTEESKHMAGFGFGKMTFDKPGTYEYQIKEVIPADTDKISGITYDTHSATFTIVVTDGGDGKLTASVSYVNNVFNNKYGTEDVVVGTVVDFDITKTLNGRDMDAGQFEFKIAAVGENKAEAAEKATIPIDGLIISNPAGSPDGVPVLLGKSSNNTKLTHEDIGKTYSYEYSETSVSGGGYTCDTNKYTLSLTALDNGDGTLSVSVVVVKTDEDGNEIDKSEATLNAANNSGDQKGKITMSFVNSYQAEVSGDLSINADKVLTGRDLKDQEFTFAIAGRTTDGTLLDKATAVNDAQGNIAFCLDGYTLDSLKEAMNDGYAAKVRDKDGRDIYTVSYTAYEKTGNLAEVGITPEVASYDFTVTVTDAGEGGKLTAVVNEPEGGIHFRNKYGEPFHIAFSGSKILNASEGLAQPDITGKFAFTISAEEADAPLPEETTVYNDRNGDIRFGDVTFTEEMLQDVPEEADGTRSRTFTYKVTETGSADGVVNDEAAEKTFTVVLTDDGAGHLTAVKEKDGPDFTFINTYPVKPETSSVTDSIEITKELTGRELVAEEFNFELVDEAGNVVATGTNDAGGKVIFTGITYSKPCEYIYTVREQESSDGNGVKYDKKTFQIKTTVSEAGGGTLQVLHELIGDEEIVFHNEYKPQNTSVIIGAAKSLIGKDLEKDQFTFQLKDADGNVISEVTNNADGKIAFEGIVYDKAGVYNYTVSEVNDGQKNVKYDDKVIHVEVTVKDDGKGYLTAEVSSDNSVFVNTYTPDGDKPGTDNPGGGDNPNNPGGGDNPNNPGGGDNPNNPGSGDNPNNPGGADSSNGVKTGDDSNLIVWIVLMLAAVAGIIGTVVCGRRKNR